MLATMAMKSANEYIDREDQRLRARQEARMAHRKQLEEQIRQERRRKQSFNMTSTERALNHDRIEKLKVRLLESKPHCLIRAAQHYAERDKDRVVSVLQEFPKKSQNI